MVRKKLTSTIQHGHKGGHQCKYVQICVPDPEEPDDGAAAEQKRRGDIAFVGKRYPEALQAYTQSLRHKTSNHVVWANRSAVYLRLNKAQAALEDARRARTLDETYTKVICTQKLLIMPLRPTVKRKHKMY